MGKIQKLIANSIFLSSRARKHYTETHSERDKAEMKEHANQHIMDSINSIREIWDASDPDVKQQIRTNLTNMISAMN